ncbi:hypothetical protein MMC31_005205, partial [Peltigera leucophlebia]|nr:hypothetical protein [Peltigera leucophlebia]
MFGLGFDTSSEVALLGIASIQGARGTTIWLILIFPLLFTAGMCLLDTVDGAMMLALYTSTSLASDKIAILYYSIVLTVITVIIAVVIGVIQFLTLILNIAEPTGKFWDGVAVAGEHYDIIGGSICASFILFGALSVLLYKPWRRHIDRKRQQSRLPQNQYEDQYEDEPAAPADLELALNDDDDNGKKKVSAAAVTTTAEHPHHDNDTADKVGKKVGVGKKDYDDGDDDDPDII